MTLDEYMSESFDKRFDFMSRHQTNELLTDAIARIRAMEADRERLETERDCWRTLARVARERARETVRLSGIDVARRVCAGAQVSG
jgi:hypothetical protein